MKWLRRDLLIAVSSPVDTRVEELLGYIYSQGMMRKKPNADGFLRVLRKPDVKKSVLGLN